MVTRQTFIILETILFRITVGISLSILIFFIVTLGISSLKNLQRKLQVRTRWRIFAALLEYLLEEIQLKGVQYKKRQRGSAVDAFETVVINIKGAKKERMQDAVKELGLLEYIKRGVKNAPPWRRMKTCHTMGILGSDRDALLLMEKLNDSNPKVVSSAIIALGELRNKKTLGALLDLFHRCTTSQTWLIAAILPFFGHQVYEYIKPILLQRELQPSRLILLVRVLSEFKLTDSLEVLQKMYKESDSLDLRISSLLAIGKINDLFAVKTIIDALSDSDWQVRAVACNLIGEMAIKGASDRLVSLLTDESWYVRKNSAAALVRLGKIGIMGLFMALNSDDRYARDMVVQTLQEQGILERIIRHLGSRDDDKLKVAYRVVKYLIKRGYKNYLENYRASYALIEKLL
ncbi:MAG: HEAT repeat domain-containing protein [Spirochaetota bacterium]|nr:MAG: HEAT repeat domain-containing protein [Spirochaetota bacterium]